MTKRRVKYGAATLGMLLLALTAWLYFAGCIREEAVDEPCEPRDYPQTVCYDDGEEYCCRVQGTCGGGCYGGGCASGGACRPCVCGG
jgi:hypothetical protein